MENILFFFVENQSTPKNYSHLIDLRSYTTKHIHVLKYQLLTFVSNVLAGELVVKMKKVSSYENELNQLVETTLHCVLWANKLSEDDAEISRYNKSILNKVYDCLNRSIALLHGSMFVKIIRNLLQQQTNEKLQRKTLEIFNGRLRDENTAETEVRFSICFIEKKIRRSFLFSRFQIVLFLPHIDQLFTIIEKFSTNEQEQTAQTALFTIKLLAKRLAEKNPQEFSSVNFSFGSKIDSMIFCSSFEGIEFRLSTTAIDRQRTTFESDGEHFSLFGRTLRYSESLFTRRITEFYAARHRNVSRRSNLET